MFLPNYRGLGGRRSRSWSASAPGSSSSSTKLGAYLRAATENPALVQAFGINVPRMITLTYGFGVALAAFAGVLAAPIYQVSPLMGADLIIVVFAVVVIGGMGSILGSIVTGFGLGIIEGLTKVFYPEASNTVIFVVMAIVLLVRPAGLFGRQSMSEAAVQRRAAPILARRADADRSSLLVGWSAPCAHLSGLPDEGALLRALRLRLQPAHRLRWAAFLRPRRCSSAGGLYRGARGEGVGLAARSSPSSLCALARRGAGRGSGRLAIRRQGIYFAMITLALAQMVYFFCLRATSPAARTASRACPAAISPACT